MRVLFAISVTVFVVVTTYVAILQLNCSSVSRTSYVKMGSTR